MFTQTIEMNQIRSHENYQLIQDEQLAFVVITNQVLAGSRILSSTYRHVVFSDCVFYACDFQGVIFENCIFENCRFEFSHIKNCKFTNCNFTDCNWKASSSINSSYNQCDLDVTFKCILERGQNSVQTLRTDYTTDIYIELALLAA